jgi:hypothetical protein
MKKTSCERGRQEEARRSHGKSRHHPGRKEDESVRCRIGRRGGECRVGCVHGRPKTGRSPFTLHFFPNASGITLGTFARGPIAPRLLGEMVDIRVRNSPRNANTLRVDDTIDSASPVSLVLQIGPERGTRCLSCPSILQGRNLLSAAALTWQSMNCIASNHNGASPFATLPPCTQQSLLGSFGTWSAD